jgi:phospholipid/cholesterol/gamma-HCH transport system permease protein
MGALQGLSSVGRRGITVVSWIGGMSILTARFVYHLKDIPRSMRVIIEQFYAIGAMSLPLIVVIAIFVGAVSAWQAAYQFKFIGAPLRYLGQAVGKAVIMELGPVLSALVIAGRVGAGITAELGTMKVTEQIDALDSMGISPNRYLMMPRVLACMLMVPLLVIFADFVAIMGGLIVAVVGVDVSTETYLNGFRSSFQFIDLVNGLVKAWVFGSIIGLVACYEGFRTKGGAEGVGEATTQSVVISMVLVLVFNFIFAVLLFRI